MRETSILLVVFNSICLSGSILIKTVLFAALYIHIYRCHVDVRTVYYVNIRAKVNHTILKNAA